MAEIDTKIVSYNLKLLGFTQAFSNTFELRNDNYLAKVVVTNTHVGLTITVLRQSVRINAQIVQSLFGLPFSYKVERGINGEEVSYKISSTGYKGLLQIIEALQKLTK